MVEPAFTLFDGDVTVTLATAPGVTVTDRTPLHAVDGGGDRRHTRLRRRHLPSFTVATAPLSLRPDDRLPVITLPFGSLGEATSCCVWPACTESDAGLTSTRTTTCDTFTVALLDLPSLAAVILAVPDVTAVTSRAVHGRNRGVARRPGDRPIRHHRSVAVEGRGGELDGCADRDGGLIGPRPDACDGRLGHGDGRDAGFAERVRGDL